MYVVRECIPAQGPVDLRDAPQQKRANPFPRMAVARQRNDPTVIVCKYISVVRLCDDFIYFNTCTVCTHVFDHHP